MSVGAPQPSWPPPPTLVPTADKAYNNGVYVIQPQPPPPLLPFLYRNPDDVDDPSSSTSRSISPLMAALIATLAAAFLVLFYYTVISRLCRRRYNRHRLRLLNPNSSSPHAADLRADAMVQDPTRPDTGLDESFIRQITVFKYKKDDGLVEGTECAVCLTEFNESESLRLMPNCEHAFHLPCIDTWLQSHSNCPLCRSTMNPLPVRSGVGSGGGGGVSVAAMQVQRGTETVLVVREVEDRGEVRVEVVEMAEEECGGNLVISEERENKLDGSNNGG